MVLILTPNRVDFQMEKFWSTETLLYCLVPTLNLVPFEVRVIWDTSASKTIGGMHEEEAIFR